MQTYFRVISHSGTSDAADLQRVVGELLASTSGVSEYDAIKPHNKGGYCLFLNYPDNDVQTIIKFLTDNDWMPCF